jgi:hypothetical protein
LKCVTGGERREGGGEGWRAGGCEKETDRERESKKKKRKNEEEEEEKEREMKNKCCIIVTSC